jgi:predicted 2-oxoglutarate/Fe(II)-dependent dioxygenase YbiX/peroxiredoxin
MSPKYVLERGDAIPNFMLNDVIGQATSPVIHSRGKPMLLVFCERDHDANLQPFAAAAEALKAADVFVITRLTPEANLALAQRAILPWGVLSDEPGDTSEFYGFAGVGKDRPALTTYTLDIGLRVLHVDRGGDPARHVGNALAAVRGLADGNNLGTAPILWIPRAMAPADCARLIAWWHEKGNEASGTIDNRANAETGAYAQTSKRRRDHEIVDQALNAELGAIFRRRIVPEVAKAFQFQATRTTGFKIAAYLDQSSTGGYFRAHRDNISPISAHRRFAVSLFLNDASDYDGGGLRFPEYGDALYRANAGEAIAFSCSLLHEVTDVTRGARFMLLTFLTNEAAMRAAQAAAGRA